MKVDQLAKIGGGSEGLSGRPLTLDRDQLEVWLMFRPKTLWPFPVQAFRDVAKHAKAFLVLELSAGQMIEDVKLAIEHKRPVSFYGRMGGMIPKSKEVLDEILSITGLKGERLK